jgi:putative glutathione S-transferase
MAHLSTRTRLAGPVDTAAHGEYRSPPGTRFAARITDDGPFTPRPFRYHLYGLWSCPWTHRLAITRELAGLHDLVTMSYVDDERDGRGWAFRAARGPDPVNGFTLLREAYEATEEGFDGDVAVPMLWDRFTSRVVSTDPAGIGVDLATRFRHLADDPVDTYPEALRDEIERLDRWIGPAVNHGVAAARHDPAARSALLEAFELLDARLARTGFLVGRVLTDADVRLWVTLVRYDAGPNADRAINPGLHVYPHLWRYTHTLRRIPAFRDTPGSPSV